MHGSNASSSSGSNYPFNFYHNQEVHGLPEPTSRLPHAANNIHTAVVQQQQSPQQQQVFDGRSRTQRNFHPTRTINGSGMEPGVTTFGSPPHIFMTDPRLTTVFSNYAKAVGMQPNYPNNGRTTFPNAVNSTIAITNDNVQQQNHSTAVSASTALDSLFHNLIVHRAPAPKLSSATTSSVSSPVPTAISINNNYVTTTAGAVSVANGRFLATTHGNNNRTNSVVPNSPSAPSASMIFAGLVSSIKEMNAPRGSPIPTLRSNMNDTARTTVGTSHNLIEVLFYPTNLTQFKPDIASSIVTAAMEAKSGGASSELAGENTKDHHSEQKFSKMMQWLVTPQHKLSAVNFIQWACACTQSFRRDRLNVWPRSQPEIDSLHGMNFLVSPPGLLGIYSESPFLRPIRLLRRVQFAAPGTVCTTLPDPDNMVRSLREIADNQVARRTSVNQGSLPPHGTAASFGFTTDFMTYVFTVELDRHIIRLLSEQVKQQTSSVRHGRSPHPEWRVVLRFGWATSDFYIPPATLNANPGNTSSSRLRRALVLESLPRMLMVRVSGRAVPLPDPIFHSGQAQKLGKRLRLSIDITDKLPIRANAPLRSRVIDIEVSWLHAPLEDHPCKLLELVAGDQMSPLLCHLIGLPLVQVTLDRAYTIAELRQVFCPSDSSGPALNLEQPISLPSWIRYNTTAEEIVPISGTVGAYDNCIPQWQHITAAITKRALKTKLEALIDTELSISGVTTAKNGDVQSEDYIPLCLLCPLTRTRIEIPVRSIQCEHLQCFDLTSYLTINYRRPRWSCPICSCQATFRDLRLDEFFASILVDPRSSNATFIHVDAQGDWRLSPEDSSETSSENALGIGNVASFSSPSASRQAPVPANETSNLCNNSLPCPTVTSPVKNECTDTLQLSKFQSSTLVPTNVPDGDTDIIVLSDEEDAVQVMRNISATSETPGTPRSIYSAAGNTNKKDTTTTAVTTSTSLPNCSDQTKSLGSSCMPLEIDLTNDDSEEDSSLSSTSSSDGPGTAVFTPPVSDQRTPLVGSTNSLPVDRSSISVSSNHSGPFVILTPVLHRESGTDRNSTLHNSSNASTECSTSAVASVNSTGGTTFAPTPPIDSVRITTGSSTSLSDLPDSHRTPDRSQQRLRLSKDPQQQTAADTSGRSLKRKPSQSLATGSALQDHTTKNYFQVASGEDGPPGVDFYGYCDDGQQLISETLNESNSLKSKSYTLRVQTSVLKQSQSSALARLMHQRSSRNSETSRTTATSTTTNRQQPSLAPRLPSTSSASAITTTEQRRRMKRTLPKKRPRHNTPYASSESADSESDDNANNSGRASNTSVFTSENSFSGDDDDDYSDDSSDCSWVPPGAQRRGRSSFSASDNSRNQRQKRKRLISINKTLLHR